MIDPKKISDLVQKVVSNLPEGVQSLPNDIKSNLRASLQAQLQAMDLVTREEFDVQTNVLQRTRKKLTELEAKLDRVLNET